MGLFLHQTTTGRLLFIVEACCLWVFSYIKPQLCVVVTKKHIVVYGSFPTSNHNSLTRSPSHTVLFMGLFLHQTTTCCRTVLTLRRLFMGLFLHQTTTRQGLCLALSRCLWVFSYIKPQPEARGTSWRPVVYGSFPTSNHNARIAILNHLVLFMGLFLHQTTTGQGCTCYGRQLFMGLFLHQTTTVCYRLLFLLCCLWVFSYIKPQLSTSTLPVLLGCLWVFSYIKPQL